LNTSLFIASRLIRGDKNTAQISKPIVKISVLSIVLGITIMILAVSIVNGFKTKIRDKVTGFGGHIQIHHYDINSSFEPNPISNKNNFIEKLNTLSEIGHIQSYAIKSGIIKTEEAIEGVILKGVSKDFNWEVFGDKIIEGERLYFSDTTTSNELVISKKIADKLKLKLNDELLMYFIQKPPRVRKFKVGGIYQTGMDEFDKLYLIGDLRHIQKLNDWDPQYISGYEVFLKDFQTLDTSAETINELIGYDLNARSIRDLYPQIFDWLNLQDINIALILSLMILVAAINMIATLLILILEKTPTIGLLKALGMKNSNLQKIFLYEAAYIIGKGLLWGNLLALSLCFIQINFGILKLDESNYYLKEVPVLMNFWHLILLNFGTLFICMLMLIIPSYFIGKISPVKAIKAD
jgi:lipoprotein-releasing system permease protein